MRAAARSLPALEVAVRRRGAPLARLKDVGVHPEAHRAPCAPPLESGTLEHITQALLFRLELDLRRPGNDDRLHTVRHVAAGNDLGRGAQVLDPRVGA